MIKRLFRSKTFYLIIGFCMAGFWLMHWVNAMGGPAIILERFGWAAPAVSIVIHAIVTMTPFPTDILAIANGSLYGFWLGAAVSWAGWYIDALIKFYIGRSASEDFPVDQWMARLPARLQRFPVDHPVFLIGTRLVPYAGGFISTFIPGALGVRWSRFVWCAALAIVPPALLMAAIGAGLLSMEGHL
jgi:uncharacterized membrane protein YdjX (TVP38/TMEM64 family)